MDGMMKMMWMGWMLFVGVTAEQTQKLNEVLKKGMMMKTAQQ